MLIEVCRCILLHTWLLRIVICVQNYTGCFPARTIHAGLPADLSGVLQAGWKSTWPHENIIDHQLCNHSYAPAQGCNPWLPSLGLQKRLDAAIFMSTYFSVLSLHLLQPFRSSFVRFAFLSFFIPFSLFVFRIYVFLLICRQFLSWPQVSCVYASRKFIPVVQESQITFFLSFFIVFFIFWSFQLPLALYILNCGRHPPLLNPFLFFHCDGSDGDYSYFPTTMIITMIMEWCGRETTVVTKL